MTFRSENHRFIEQIDVSSDVFSRPNICRRASSRSGSASGKHGGVSPGSESPVEDLRTGARGVSARD